MEALGARSGTGVEGGERCPTCCMYTEEANAIAREGKGGGQAGLNTGPWIS